MATNNHRMWVGAMLIAVGAILSMTGASVGAYVAIMVLGTIVLISGYETKER